MRLILVVALLLPLAALCQSKKKNLPVFGKIDKEELLSRSCEFDKDAEAMVLYESGRRYFDMTGRKLYLKRINN